MYVEVTESIHFESDEDVAELLEEYKKYWNDNRTRAIEDIIRSVEQARDATELDDPEAAIEELIRGYPDSRTGEYDPDTYVGLLPESRLEELGTGTITPINPEHVSPESVPQSTWTKAGIVAGILLYRAGVVDEVDERKIKPTIRRYCGGRTSVRAEDVRYRLNHDVPVDYRVDFDLNNWVSNMKAILGKEEYTPDKSAVENWRSRARKALREMDTSDERHEEVENILDELEEVQEELRREELGERMDKISRADGGAVD